MAWLQIDHTKQKRKWAFWFVDGESKTATALTDIGLDVVGKALDEREIVNSTPLPAAQSASNSEEEREDDKGLTDLYEIWYLKIIAYVGFNLFNTQSRILQADWLILENIKKVISKINMLMGVKLWKYGFPMKWNLMIFLE